MTPYLGRRFQDIRESRQSSVGCSSLIKKDFYPSWKYTPFLLCAFAIGNMEAFIGSILNGIKKTWICFLSTLAGATVNIILNLLLIPVFQVYGAIAATIIGYFVIYVTHVVGVKKYVDINLNVIKSVISLILLLVIGYCYISESIIVRLCAIAFSVLMCLIFKEELSDMVRIIIRRGEKIFKKYVNNPIRKK